MKRRTTVSTLLATTCLVGPLSMAFAAGEPTNQRPAPASSPVVVHASNGFDWGDAGIGAAAGMGAVLAAAGGITLVRNK